MSLKKGRKAFLAEFKKIKEKIEQTFSHTKPSKIAKDYGRAGWREGGNLPVLRGVGWGISVEKGYNDGHSDPS